MNEGLKMGLAALASLLVAAGCSPKYEPYTTCESTAEVTVDCRFNDPEDLAQSPSGRYVIASEMSSLEGTVTGGGIVAYDPASGELQRLLPSERTEFAAEPTWGDPACGAPDPTNLATHGIDIEKLSDGSDRLLVVNHGGRESIELFEIVESDSDIRLIWRGCVEAEGDMYFNDVVGHPDGSFWASHMYPRGGNATWEVIKMQALGSRPGRVYGWSRSGGFEAVPGSESAFANGLEKSEDGKTLFLNAYFGGGVFKIDVATGEVLGHYETDAADNLTWSSDGRLIVAVHPAPFPDVMACLELEEGHCGIPFEIVALDPKTMEASAKFAHSGPPVGGATVGLEHDGRLYLGAFSGDRLASVPISVLAPAGG